MKLKPLLILAGAAGAAAVVLKRRGGGEQPQPHASYAPPAEALAQEPVAAGGPPSSEAQVTRAAQIVSEPGEQLNVPEHEPPEGAVMPDTSSDALVDSQTAAAMGDAGSIGGDVDEKAADDEGFPEETESSHRDA